MRNSIFQEPEIAASLSDAWKQLRVSVIVPVLRFALIACVLMSIMLFIERLYMTAVILYVKALGKKRYTQYKLDAVREKMKRDGEYPKVLIQIPMYNESEVNS